MAVFVFWQGLQVSSQGCSWDTVCRFWSLCLFGLLKLGLIWFSLNKDIAQFWPDGRTCVKSYYLEYSNSRQLSSYVLFLAVRWAAAVLTRRQGSSCVDYCLFVLDFERDLMIHALTVGKLSWFVMYGRLSWTDVLSCAFDCFGRSEEVLNMELIVLIGNWSCAVLAIVCSCLRYDNCDARFITMSRDGVTCVISYYLGVNCWILP